MRAPYLSEQAIVNAFAGALGSRVSAEVGGVYDEAVEEAQRREPWAQHFNLPFDLHFTRSGERSKGPHASCTGIGDGRVLCDILMMLWDAATGAPQALSFSGTSVPLKYWTGTIESIAPLIDKCVRAAASRGTVRSAIGRGEQLLTLDDSFRRILVVGDVVSFSLWTSAAMRTEVLSSSRMKPDAAAIVDVYLSGNEIVGIDGWASAQSKYVRKTYTPNRIIVSRRGQRTGQSSP